jgi:hypothetical protein
VDILAFLENDSVADAVDPAGIFLACCQALQAVGDSRHFEVVTKGHQFLLSIAGQLPEEQRQMYFENVPSNRALLGLWNNEQPG